MARWKAWLCTLGMPEMAMPPMRSASGGTGASGTMAEIAPASTATATSLRQPSASKALSKWNRFTSCLRYRREMVSGEMVSGTLCSPAAGSSQTNHLQLGGCTIPHHR